MACSRRHARSNEWSGALEQPVPSILRVALRLDDRSAPRGQEAIELATTAQRPASGGPPGDASDDLKAIEPLFSRVTPPLPPVQFIGSTGARYNMGGGQPDPTSLPRQVLTEIVARLLASDEGQGALMYGDASGYLGLREAIADKLRRWEHLEVAPDELLIVNGSNHGLALTVQAFVNPGEVAVVEAPTFMGGLRPMRQLGVQVEMVPLDEQGIQTDALEAEAAGAAGRRDAGQAPLHHPQLPQPRRGRPLPRAAQARGGAGRALQLRDPGGRRLRGAALLRRSLCPRSTAWPPGGASCARPRSPRSSPPGCGWAT